MKLLTAIEIHESAGGNAVIVGLYRKAGETDYGQGLGFWREELSIPMPYWLIKARAERMAAVGNQLKSKQLKITNYIELNAGVSFSEELAKMEKVK